MTRRLTILTVFLLFSILSAAPNWLGHVFGQGDSSTADDKAQVTEINTAAVPNSEEDAEKCVVTGDKTTAPRHHFNVEALNFDEEGFDWHTDWWKAILIGLAVAVIITLLVKACMMLLKLAGIIVCLIIATVVSFCLQSSLLPWVKDSAPEALLDLVDAKYLTFFLAFLIGLIVSAIVGRLVHGVFSGKDAKKTNLL